MNTFSKLLVLIILAGVALALLSAGAAVVGVATAEGAGLTTEVNNTWRFVEPDVWTLAEAWEAPTSYFVVA